MTKIFIVHGTAGDYSERAEWTAKAFMDKKSAEKYCDLASSKAREIYSAICELINNGKDCCSYTRKAKNLIDPKMKKYSSCELATYFISKCELDLHGMLIMRNK